VTNLKRDKGVGLGDSEVFHRENRQDRVGGKGGLRADKRGQEDKGHALHGAFLSG
jgi:hypothetical protein